MRMVWLRLLRSFMPVELTRRRAPPSASTAIASSSPLTLRREALSTTPPLAVSRTDTILGHRCEPGAAGAGPAPDAAALPLSAAAPGELGAAAAAASRALAGVTTATAAGDAVAPKPNARDGVAGAASSSSSRSPITSLYTST